MTGIQGLIGQIEATARSFDCSHLGDLLEDLDLAVIANGGVPDSVPAMVVGLLQNEGFLALQESWRLPQFLMGDLRYWSGEQRETIRAPLTFAFDRFADWMGAFLSAEILGGLFADAASLDALRQLAETARLPGRALVPHGLEALARNSPDQALRDEAIRELRLLETSPSLEVRSEAKLCLGRVSQGPLA